ncbi:DUF6668 family protein [Nocardiopsis kunsanensis]|uniref:Uncharacterized protein n=1 Tax=Nocardiopsis kunsanensis TaxID=141693 RepID=A0A919CJH6_9ACTN|nr:DUF6668 family protein [Nocardiopsis kunsanensis]GHD31264.1 hypothetical protein GCM10007147_33970 [Nocardiopsis kunsanensis]
MGENVNPWVTRPPLEEAPDQDPTVPDDAPATTGPQSPQGGVPLPSDDDRLPRRRVSGTAHVWFLGVHGGAGESTLAGLVPDARPAGHAWPEVATPPGHAPARVVLVARTHASGLRSAQLAATEWASGSASGIELIGLVLVADAPGKLPRPLKDMAKVIKGGVPRTWSIPWIESWRLDEPVDVQRSPKSVRSMIADLDALSH